MCPRVCRTCIGKSCCGTETVAPHRAAAVLAAQPGQAAPAPDASSSPGNGEGAAPQSRSEYDDIPPPDGPDLPDDPGPDSNYDAPPPDPSAISQEDVDEMFAEAATPADPSTRRDPEEVAMELLKDVLGARPIDEK